MTGRGYTVFDTPIGRCGLAWGPSGIIAIQLAAGREIETRRLLLRQVPEARELEPPADIGLVIDGLVGLLRRIFPMSRSTFATCRRSPGESTTSRAQSCAATP